VFEAPVVVLQTGTSAGRITLAPELDAQGMRIHPQPAGVELEISASPPVLSLVRAERTAAGFDVIAAGFSTTRELGQAVFRFTGAAGADLRTAEVAVDLTAEAAQWFGSAEAAPAGGLFLYRQSFTVQGDPAAAQAVAVELRNTAGKSAGAAAKLD
jgi:hypothetical protein